MFTRPHFRPTAGRIDYKKKIMEGQKCIKSLWLVMKVRNEKKS